MINNCLCSPKITATANPSGDLSSLRRVAAQKNWRAYSLRRTLRIVFGETGDREFAEKRWTLFQWNEEERDEKTFVFQGSSWRHCGGSSRCFERIRLIDWSCRWWSIRTASLLQSHSEYVIQSNVTLQCHQWSSLSSPHWASQLKATM